MMVLPHTTKLLIADHDATRRGIRLALGDDVEICAETGDAAEAVMLAQREQPEVCLVGLGISGGAAAVQRICGAAPSAAVVVLGEPPDVDDMLASLQAGAVGYLPGSIDAAPLRRVVGAVRDGEAAVPRAMVIELARELQKAGRRAERLTAREAQVLSMVRRGESTAAVAECLSISPVTARRHISAVMQKLGVETRAELATVNVRTRLAHRGRVAPPRGTRPRPSD
jgi:DNA-binding NarL/FixJ family response regulator